MKGTRNTLTARFGAGLSHRVRQRALWGDVAPRVSCQQCETPVHAAVDLADPGPGGPVASGCVGRAPAHPRPDHGAQVAGLALCWDRQAVLVLQGHMPFFSLGLYSRPQDGLARGCSGGGSLPPQAPLPAPSAWAHPDLAPFRGPSSCESPVGEEAQTDLCTNVETRQQEEPPERGLAEAGWPWARASSC